MTQNISNTKTNVPSQDGAANQHSPSEQANPRGKGWTLGDSSSLVVDEKERESKITGALWLLVPTAVTIAIFLLFFSN